MTLRFLAFLTIAIAISLTSCQKEFTVDDILNDTIIAPPSNPLDSSYIDSIIVIEGDASVSIDTDYIKMKYDAAKRLTDFTNANESINKYRYNSLDSLPYLTLVDEGDDFDSVFHFYNAGKLLKDSLIRTSRINGFKFRKEDNYTYTNSNIFSTSKYVRANGDISFYKDSTSKVGNVLTNKGYTSYDGGLTYEYAGTNTFTFDDKLSPFAGRGMLASDGIEFTDDGFFLEHLFANNYTSFAHIDYLQGVPNGIFTINNTFTYYPNGRVKTQTELQPPGSTYIYKIIYKYKAL